MPQHPQDLAELEAQISAAYAGLSRRLQQTAGFLLDHPREVAFSTAARLAERASVTPSTLVRFAHGFGFSGFSAMQQLFRDRLLTERPSYAERIHAVHSATGESPDGCQLLREFADASCEALEELAGHLAPEPLEQAVELLDQASVVHVQGARRSFTLASYLGYALQHIGRRVLLMDGLGGMDDGQVQRMSQDDILLAVSFAPYARETCDAAAAAREHTIPVVAITDSGLSPLALLADVTLVVREAEVKGFRGLSASLCLAQSLAITLGIRRDTPRISGDEPPPLHSGLH